MLKELEIVWDYPAGFGGVTRMLTIVRQEEQNQRESRDDATPLALAVEEGATGQHQTSAEAGRGAEAEFPQSL